MHRVDGVTTSLGGGDDPSVVGHREGRGWEPHRSAAVGGPRRRRRDTVAASGGSAGGVGGKGRSIPRHNRKGNEGDPDTKLGRRRTVEDAPLPVGGESHDLGTVQGAEGAGRSRTRWEKGREGRGRDIPCVLLCVYVCVCKRVCVSLYLCASARDSVYAGGPRKPCHCREITSSFETSMWVLAETGQRGNWRSESAEGEPTCPTGRGDVGESFVETLFHRPRGWDPTTGLRDTVAGLPVGSQWRSVRPLGDCNSEPTVGRKLGHNPVEPKRTHGWAARST